MACLSLSLLGTVEVTLAGQPVAAFGYDKVRALLVYLAVEADHPHRREAMAGLLWPELPEPGAHHNLSQALFRLRRAIGDRQAIPPSLIITRQALQFNPASDYCLDVTDFRRLLAVCQAHSHPRLAACDACLERLAGALALYRGDFLADLEVDMLGYWMERHRLRDLYLGALEELAALHARQGKDREASELYLKALTLDPCRESALQPLMRLALRRGERAAALAHCRRLEQALWRELRIQPGQETQSLRRQAGVEG
jgi:DNA-binding SARP family transcriptional activator